MGHGAHGAEDAPGAGLEQDHDDETDEGGGQHHTVKAEGELGHPGGEDGAVIGPVPGDPEGPEQLDGSADRVGAGAHQIRHPKHLKEHGKEENQESVPEPLGANPAGRGMVAGQFPFFAQKGEELPPVAVTVAIELIAAENGDKQGETEENHANPGKEDVEEAQSEVDGRHNP